MRARRRTRLLVGLEQSTCQGRSLQLLEILTTYVVFQYIEVVEREGETIQMRFCKKIVVPSNCFKRFPMCWSAIRNNPMRVLTGFPYAKLEADRIRPPPLAPSLVSLVPLLQYASPKRHPMSCSHGPNRHVPVQCGLTWQGGYPHRKEVAGVFQHSTSLGDP